MTVAREINDVNIKEVVDIFSTKMNEIYIDFINSGKDEKTFNEKIGKFNYRNIVFEIKLSVVLSNDKGEVRYSDRYITAITNERAKLDFQKLTKYSYSVNYPCIERNSFTIDYFASETIGKTINDMKDSIDKFIVNMEKEIESYTDKIVQLNDIMKMYR